MPDLSASDAARAADATQAALDLSKAMLSALLGVGVVDSPLVDLLMAQFADADMDGLFAATDASATDLPARRAEMRARLERFIAYAVRKARSEVR